MTLGSTQLLTEMSTRNIPGGKGGRCVGLTTLPPSCSDCLKSGSLKLLEPSGPDQACAWIALHFYNITTLPFAQGPEIQKFVLRVLGTSKAKIIESQLTLKN